MSKKQYDIFISYRRSSYDIANLIATRLKAEGYSVFFDMEALRAGKFNEQLYDVIDNCTDFVSVLPPEALDRCVNEDDWVRLEICRAIEKKKNIVPVMLNGFTWPSPMPKGMEELRNYQALTANSIEYFDMAMERLQTRYLLSKRHLPVRKIMKVASIVVTALLAVVGILWGVFMMLSQDVCQKYATSLTKDANHVHLIAETNSDLKKDWEKFNLACSYERKPERMAEMQQSMLDRLDVAEKSLKQTWAVDSVPMDISPYHSFLLSLHGINAEEMAISPQFVTLYYKDYLEQLEAMRRAAREPSTIYLRYVDALFEMFGHSINSYYASLLCELSPFPENSLTTFNEMHKLWTHFPNNYEMGKERSFYEDIVNKESLLAQDALSRYASMLEEQDAQLEDQQFKLDSLETAMNEGFGQLQMQTDSAATAMYQAMAEAEITRIKQDNEQELSMRREKVEAKKKEVEASRAQLEELDKQYVQTYESLKAKCTLEEEDDQWYKWGKIRRWGSFLAMVTQSRQQLEAEGIRSASSVTPEMANAEMSSLLSVYQTYHPESKDYVAAAKQFYREVSKGKRTYAGVIIFGFKDDASHPYFRKGDIVTEYNGKPIKDYDAFKAAFKADETGTVTFLRLDGSSFDEIKKPIEQTDIVGFLDLTE